MATEHPKGLKPLFLTEMWERLGFYLIVGILYLYIIDTERGGLGMSNADAGEIYGTYLAFVYFTPFLGGLIADRYLGFRRSVFIGGLLMAAGYFALGVRSMPTFYGGLVLICLGNGLDKPLVAPCLLLHGPGKQLYVAPVGPPLPGLPPVCELRVQDGTQDQLQSRILHRRQQLDPVFEISSHRIRRTDPVLLVPRVPEVVDPRMLEELPEHADHANVLRQAFDSRPEAAGVTHDQIDPDSGA